MSFSRASTSAPLCLAVWMLGLGVWAENPGPSSRRTGIAISEIMYHPATGTNLAGVEFVELYNSQPIPEDISGWRLSGDWDFTFPSNTIIQPSTYLVVSPDPNRLRIFYNLTNVLGGFTNTLPNDGGMIRLRNRTGAILLEVKYTDQPPWPVAADGAGHSLVLANPSYGEGDPRAWAASKEMGGSPGGPEPTYAEPLRGIVINEILANSGTSAVDFVEIYNHSTQTNDLSGCVLTDDPATNKFIVPLGTLLLPRQILVFTEIQLGFGLKSAGDSVYLLSSNRTRVLDVVRFEGQGEGVALGRCPDGAADFYPLAQPTPGDTNAPMWISDVVLNEIMYQPPSGDSEDEFIELFNRSTNAVDLSRWRLVDGISFSFPSNTLIAAGGYFVIAKDAARTRTNYPYLTAAKVAGNYTGTLANNGQRIALTRPALAPDGKAFDIVVDEVRWYAGGRWGRWSDGGGSSLELRDAHSDHRRADDWADSDESLKSQWTTVEFTGSLIQGDGGTSQRLEVIIAGPGECLIDDVEVIYQGANLVAANDASFNNGRGSWIWEGSHEMSAWQANGGTQNSPCLLLRADVRGDYYFNRARVGLTAPIPAGATATLRAKARWLRGEPEVILRLTGNHLEAVGRLPVPANLGTPGLPNTALAANAGPAIFDVTHFPVLPANSQPVVISARVSDPDGITNVTVVYRVDGVAGTTSVLLRDAGTGGDSVAGDGIFSATLPGQSSGKIIAFRVIAWDGRGATNSFPTPRPIYPGDTAGPECLVRFGESQPTLGPRRFSSYHLWITQATFNRWSSRGSAHNSPLDCTFVYDDQRVVYNVGALYSGSLVTMASTSTPLDPPTGGKLAGYNLVFPADNLFLGADDVVLDSNMPGYIAQHEQAPFWLARELGITYNHRRFVNVFLNGTRRGSVYEDAQQPNRQVAKEFYPDDEAGDLYKVEVWWGTTDFSSGFGGFHGEPPLANYPRGAGKNLARYRWTFQKRAAIGSPSDYRTVFALVDGMTASASNYTAAVESVMDVEQWMRTLAMERLVGNLDSWGVHAPHNMYAYKPEHRGWQLLAFDMDYSFYGGESPDSDLVSGAFAGDAQLDALVNHPPFTRAYLRAIKDAADGPLARDAGTGRLPKVDAFLDANYQAVSVVNGVGADELSPDYLGAGWGYTFRGWFTRRRQAIANTLARYGNPAFTANSAPAASGNLVTLSGTAPITIKTITVNGAEYPVTWTGVTTWTLTLAAASGTNGLTIQGLDRSGSPVQSPLNQLVVVTNALDMPDDNLVINEIQYHPLVPGAGFIEIYNRSANTAFDLSGWRLEGVDFTFPGGTVAAPGSFVVVAKDRTVFGQTYGFQVRLAGEYGGDLNNRGETLALIKPGATTAQDQVIDWVSYEDAAPWPSAADGLSLQLIDAAQDNSRVANWTIASTNSSGPPPATPGVANSVRAVLPDFPLIWLNEIEPDNASGISDGAGDRDPWVELYNAGATPIALDGWYLARRFANLTEWSFPSNRVINPGQFLLVWLDGEPGETTAGELHANFRAAPYDGVLVLSRSTTNQPLVLDYLRYGEISADYSLGFYPDGLSRSRRVFYHPTPGATNDNTPAPLPIFINEWMADNTRTLTDLADGDCEDWFELYNPNPVAVDLSGYYLTDDLQNPTQWKIPLGTAIAPFGFRLVWADGETGQNTEASDLHANFKLNKEGEAIGLFAPNGQLVDAVTFGAQTSDVSQGRWPPGAPEPYYFMPSPTPRADNVIALADTPLIQILALTNGPGGERVMVWSAQPGRRYRTLYRDALVGPGWTNLPGEVLAETELASQTLVVDAGQPQRFLRIELLTGPTGDTTSPPPRPAGVTAVSGSGRVVINWIGSVGADSYRVKRGTVTGTFPTTFTVAAPPFEDTAVANGTTYYYVVSAVQGAQESPNSREVSATPLAPPAGFSALAQADGVLLNWQPATGATGYRIKRGLSTGIYSTVFTVLTSPYQDLSVQSGTAYFYVISTVFGALESVNSAEVRVAMPLLAPTNLSAISGSNQVTLNWQLAYGATGYDVQRGVGPGAYSERFTTADLFFTDTNVVNGTTYFYAVAARNNDGLSANSSEVSITPLAPPPGFTLTPGTNLVIANWQLSTGATSYHLKRGINPGVYTATFSVAAPPYTDNTVQSNITYFYAVSAVKGVSESANSSEARIRLGSPAEVIYVDDSTNLPQGGQFQADADSWTWVTNNPTPYSGRDAHQSSTYGYIHQHFFINATNTMAIGSNDVLFCYVYLNSATMPASLMLQWYDATGVTGWDHRAYWGANNFYWGFDGTASRRRMGDIPAAGAWVRLEVPANLVDLGGKSIAGVAFTLYGGSATWDYAGKRE